SCAAEPQMSSIDSVGSGSLTASPFSLSRRARRNSTLYLRRRQLGHGIRVGWLRYANAGFRGKFQGPAAGEQGRGPLAGQTVWECEFAPLSAANQLPLRPKTL